MLEVTPQLQIPLAEFQFAYSRSSGPGGQNVNKVSTKATLRWPVSQTSSLPEPVRQRFLARYKRRITKEGELVLSSQRFRDRERNVSDCLEKLRALLLEVATPPKRRKPTRPTSGSKRRRLDAKRKQSEKKQQRGSHWDS